MHTFNGLFVNLEQSRSDGCNKAQVRFPARTHLLGLLPVHGCAPFLPYWPVRLKAVKPEALENQSLTLAASLRRVRRARGLLQREVAESMGVSHTSVLDWEAGKEPEVHMYPRILAFLTFELWPEPETLAERLLAERGKRGWSMRLATAALKVDEGTWRR